MAARKPGIKAPYPGFIEPALGTSITKVPSSERWLHEIKFDGYRVRRSQGRYPRLWQGRPELPVNRAELLL
jgi:hypothetical protein